jgi:BolA family transcriptional regulator, general stress-responsive regulator
MTISSQTERLARIRQLLEARFAPTALEIQDESAAHAGHAGAREGGHFRVTIASLAFHGLAPLARHRLVYEALADMMGHGIHALNIAAHAPDERTQAMI